MSMFSPRPAFTVRQLSAFCLAHHCIAELSGDAMSADIRIEPSGDWIATVNLSIGDWPIAFTID